MRSPFAAALMGALLSAAAAQAADVKTDYDHAYDFSKLKTFSIRVGTSWGNPLGEERVVQEFTDALKARGWTQAAEAQADAAVVVHGAGKTKRTLNTFYDGMGGGWGWGGWGSATTTASEYLVGTLVVDIFDAHTKKLVFRGTASDEVSDKPEKNVKKVEKAADKMFKEFPPGSGKK